jgi:hypothetical protein
MIYKSSDRCETDQGCSAETMEILEIAAENAYKDLDPIIRFLTINHDNRRDGVFW